MYQIKNEILFCLIENKGINMYVDVIIVECVLNKIIRTLKSFALFVREFAFVLDVIEMIYQLNLKDFFYYWEVI